jgi:general secretion pathway protein G
MKRSSRGFTLVEILIVVIILGILAAIVIPQFTNASNDARNNSTASTLQTLRSQLELFKIQHADTPPQDATALWTVLGGKTSSTDTTAVNASGTLGPYVQNPPANPVNGFTTAAAAAAANVGWVYSVGTNGYYISATNTTGTGILTY